MAEENQTQSIQARIAALNLGHVGRAPITANGGKPEPPSRPSLDERSQSSAPATTLHNRASSIGNEPNGPRRNGVLPPPADIVRTGQMQAEQKQAKAAYAPAPRLPTRKQSDLGPSPSLPPRRTSDQLNRKASNESIASNISVASTLSIGQRRNDHSRASSTDTGGRIKAPTYDPSTLPPLPPKRNKEEENVKGRVSYRASENKQAPVKHLPTVEIAEVKPAAAAPVLPPRKASKQEPSLPPRKLPPPSDHAPPNPARSALSFGLNKTNVEDPATQRNGREPSPAPPEPERPSTAIPPPVPLSSRPDLSQIQATKPRATAPAQGQAQPYTNGAASGCLICRDFSAPDNHAAKFPRQSVPSLDWLATQLTSPFANSPTDQARCIFTWLHHNIAYDTVSFFNNNVQPSTPASTLSSGLAVCEGYAGLFTALAIKIGLESIVVSGHGKGYSFSPLKPGEPIPAEYSTHAWNAVKIDGGEWKLLDPCWGAGHVNGKNQPYTKHFSPRMFTMSNDEFGLRHFPTNRSHFFRSDGRQVNWEDYIVGERGGEPVTVYSGVVEREGLSERSITPRQLHISIPPSSSGSNHTTRFQFSRVCPHWSPLRNGEGPDYVFILAIHGLDGRQDDYVPFEPDGAGHWAADVETRRLGARGQTISLYTVESVGGESGRGLTVRGFREAKGRKGMGFGGVSAWELV